MDPVFLNTEATSDIKITENRILASIYELLGTTSSSDKIYSTRTQQEYINKMQAEIDIEAIQIKIKRLGGMAGIIKYNGINVFSIETESNQSPAEPVGSTSPTPAESADSVFYLLLKETIIKFSRYKEADTNEYYIEGIERIPIAYKNKLAVLGIEFSDLFKDLEVRMRDKLIETLYNQASSRHRMN